MVTKRDVYNLRELYFRNGHERYFGYRMIDEHNLMESNEWKSLEPKDEVHEVIVESYGDLKDQLKEVFESYSKEIHFVDYGIRKGLRRLFEIEESLKLAA